MTEDELRTANRALNLHRLMASWAAEEVAAMNSVVKSSEPSDTTTRLAHREQENLARAAQEWHEQRAMGVAARINEELT